MSSEQKSKISIAKKGVPIWEGSRIFTWLTGDKNSNWKGNDVGYDALHDWVNRCLGKAQSCSFNKTHKATRYHWANVSGDYLRDLGDWISLCPICHKQYDKLLHHPKANVFTDRNVRVTLRA